MHSEGNVLPFAIGEKVSLLGGLHAVGAAAFAFTTLAEVFGVRRVGGSTAISANTHGASAAGEYPLDDPFDPFGDGVAVFSE